MIRHTVAFTLKHEAGSDGERNFLERALVLTSIPTVENFQQLRQVSPKCDYAFGFSMEFADRAAYEAYNAHPVHQSFVADYWQTEVAAFQEIDYEPL